MVEKMVESMAPTMGLVTHAMRVGWMDEQMAV